MALERETFLASLITMLSFLLLAVKIDYSHNPLSRSHKYRIARRINWLLIGLLYMFFYTGRYNMSVINNEEVREFLGATKTQYGLILTVGHFSYALSMVSEAKRSEVSDPCGRQAYSHYSHYSHTRITRITRYSAM